ncbi:hypothetical protein KAU11_11940 [Candidatus Babeliales bacterium]|nr:hypothetical protein [Candidatus Babeliales bacterium]
MAGKYKELEIVPDERTPLYKLRYVGGGELPDVLKTLYTSTREAIKARDLYYKSKVKKKVSKAA